MVLWIGFDDTDSLRGMCTTFLATEIVRELTPTHNLIGYPRLVRLNPSIPWKTRGNGALALRFGQGRGPSWTVGRIAGREILAFSRSRGGEDPRSLRGALETLVERWAAFDDDTTNPAFVILSRQPSPGLYWRAVRGIVTRTDARRAVSGLGIVRTYKNGRGIIGAAAALSWRPRDRTYEVLTYRDPAVWGLHREVDPESVAEMDRAFPSTFNNYDYANQKVVIAPHSPCPVLFGIRGDAPEDLRPAMERIRGERPERWLLFETNQGTDDHITKDDWSLEPYTSTSLEGRVASFPATRIGGHVLFDLEGRNRITVAAYEPSKQFRNVVRALRPGDHVRVYGSLRDEPRSLNLEKIQVIALAHVARKIGNPRCPVCRKSMKSVGHHAGYRCVRGHARVPYEASVRVTMKREIGLGFYEPPASARRHLAKPLQRLRTRESADSLGREIPAQGSAEATRPDARLASRTRELRRRTPPALGG